MDKTNKMKQKKKNIAYLVLAIVLLGATVGGLFWAFMPGSILNPGTPTTDTSTFEYKDYITGEDVSWVPLTIWTPKAGSTFNDLDDVYNVAKYQASASSRASALSIDLSDYTYVLVQADPDDDAPYSENWNLIMPNGGNYEYTIYAKDPTTDVNFNIVDSTTMNEVTVADHQTDGNYTLIYDCPHYTTTAAQMHYGTNWDLSATEFADLSQTQQEWYWDEANIAGQFPIFNPQDDTYSYKSTLSHAALADFTDCFAFKFTFNDSISIVDGSDTQVNFTVTDDSAFEVAVSGEVIYLVSYEPILFTGGILNLNFEITYAVNITLSDVDSGNVKILQSGNSFGAFTKLSDIAA